MNLRALASTGSVLSALAPSVCGWPLLLLMGVAVSPEVAGATKPGLAGHWVTEIEEPNGDIITLIMDLGMVNDRWVGEFDFPDYDILNYPIEVESTGPKVSLYLSAIGASFEGTIDANGTLSGIGRSEGRPDETITFRRTGPAEFSEGLLELEAAADDPSLVEILSDDGSELKERFNADREKTRLLMLLSPT